MISDYKKQQVIKKAEKVYKEIAEDDKQLSEDFLSICAEPIVTYKSTKKALQLFNTIKIRTEGKIVK